MSAEQFSIPTPKGTYLEGPGCCLLAVWETTTTVPTGTDLSILGAHLHASMTGTDAYMCKQ